MYVTITGAFTGPDATPATGTVRFTLVPPVRVADTGPLVAGSVTVTLDPDGAFSVPLFANTDPTVLPAGSYYVVQEAISGARGEYAVTVPHDAGSPLELAALARVET